MNDEPPSHETRTQRSLNFEEEDAGKWRGRDIVCFGFVFIALNMFVPGLVNLLPFRGESANAFRALVGTVIVQLTLIGLIYALARYEHGLRFLEEMRWSRDYKVRNGTFLTLGMGLAFSVMLVSSVFPPSSPPIEELLSTREAVVIFAIYGIAFAPFLEELLFRGFLFRVLEQTAGVSVAILVTAVLFALLHVPQLWGSWAGMLLIFAVGFILSTLRARTGSLIPTVIVHTAYNGMLFLAFAVGSLYEGSV
jgi:membrane protease YdiL (CAAX protease family)